MPQSTRTSFHRMFDRTWRPGHPFRPRRSRRRRVGVPILFALLLAIIGGYSYLTNSRRVQAMAQAYLSQLTGGRAEVGHATLSIFQGLRLEKVRVFVRNDQHTPIFSAASLAVNYNPAALLAGRVEASDITATDARVVLDEDEQTGQWNFQAVEPPPPGPAGPPEKWTLPRITVRNGSIEYRQTRQGELVPGRSGTMTIDGSFWPRENKDEGYTFSVQSRGQSASLGFDIAGSFSSAKQEPELIASVRHVQFGRDIEVMLPHGVREWWQRHELSGAIDLPQVRLRLPRGASVPDFRLELQARDLSLKVDPREWAIDTEARQLITLDHATALLHLAGITVSPDVFAPPVRLQHGHGEITFTPEGIKIEHLQADLAGNQLQIDGHIDGLQPASAGELHFRADGMVLVEPLPLLGTLPQPIRNLLQMVRPHGKGNVEASYSRATAGARPEIRGHVDITDGAFCYALFPYPMRNVTGRIAFAPDVDHPGELACQLINLRCFGPENGPNADRPIFIDATIAPANDDAAVHLTLRSDGLVGEPALVHALSPEAQAAIALFDANGDGKLPTFTVDVRSTTTCEYGPHQPLQTSVDLDVKDAAGTLKFFPYPMHHAEARLHIDGHGVQVRQFSAVGGPGDETQVSVEGEIKVSPHKPAEPDLNVTVTHLPIDQTLLAALPSDRWKRLEKLGLAGTLDVSGRITPSAATTQPFDYALDLSLRDGSLQPVGEKITLSAVKAQAHLTPAELNVTEFHALRGDAEISGHGTARMTEDFELRVVGSAKNLALDAPLRHLLPPSARDAWDAVAPVGTVDADLKTNGPNDFDLTLHPRKLSATVAALPYRLDDIKGTIHVDPKHITLADLSAHHGNARIAVSGEGKPTESAWDLKISGRDLPVDDDLRKAVPDTVRTLLDKSHLQGTLSFDLKQLTCRPPTTAPATLASTGPAAGPDIDLSGRLWLKQGKATLGLPVTDIDAVADLAAKVRGGKFSELSGSIDAATLQIADRKASEFHTDLLKPADRQAVRFDRVQLQIAGGVIAGQVQMSLGESGPERYAVNLALQNGDVKQLIGNVGDRKVSGQINASLALEGAWNDASTQRGRGDVQVTGENLYEVPVMGLLQITNLSLPLSSPFHEATCRYNIDGQKVTFEKIELKARNMLMQGDGVLDYGHHSVKLTFTTDNPAWPKLPLITDIRHEMLQIHISGSVQQPKVSASMFDTLTTTVDEVTHGNAPRR